MNRGKRSIVLNLAEERGREVFRKLVAVSDVVINNYTPRVLRTGAWATKSSRRYVPTSSCFRIQATARRDRGRPFPFKVLVLENTMGITAYSGYRDDKPWKVGQSYPDSSPAGRDCWH